MSDYQNILNQAKSMERRAKQHYDLYKRLTEYAKKLRIQAKKINKRSNTDEYDE
jgi:hypothetical protein